MADRITLNFDANTQRVEQGADRMADSLDDTERKLDDLGSAGEDAGDSAAQGLDKAADSADDLGAKGEDATGQIVDGLLGVAGIAGGVAGVVSQGLGAAFDFVKDKVDEQIEAAAELRAGLVAAYRDAAEEGQTYLSQAQIIAAAQDIIFDDAKREKARADAAAIGVDLNTYIKSQAGDYAALQVVIAATAQAEADRREEGSDGSKSSQADALQEIQNLERIQAANQKLIDAHEENQQAAQLAIDLQQQLGQEERARIQRTQDADQARYEAAAANFEKLAGTSVVVPVDADTSAAEAAIQDLLGKRRPAISLHVRVGREVP